MERLHERHFSFISCVIAETFQVVRCRNRNSQFVAAHTRPNWSMTCKFPLMMTQNHSYQAESAQCDVMAFLRLNTVTLIYCIELRCASRSNSLVQQIPFRLLISPKFSPTISQMVIFSRVIWRTLHPGWATFDSYPCFELQFHRQCGDSMFLSAFAWGHQMTSSLRYAYAYNTIYIANILRSIASYI